MVKYLDLQKITALRGEQIKMALDRVSSSGIYLRGNETKLFETEYAQFIGSSHCVGVANGLDALRLIIRAYIEMGRLSYGDKIIVPSNTFIASVLAITDNGLEPVFVEPDIDTFQIDSNLLEHAIDKKVKAVMIVHLYGRCAYNQRIANICDKQNLLLIEDNAQAHGCLYFKQRTGSLGHAAAHSFYPGKNLGAFGDAGAVTTSDSLLAQTIRAISNYGENERYECRYRGVNSRLDEIQAAILRIKLNYLDSDNNQRIQIARYYIENIDNPLVKVPDMEYLEKNVFHIFPLLTTKRDQLREFMAHKGIETLIHYPLPPHKQQCYSAWNHLSLPIAEMIGDRELSLPISPAMTMQEMEQTVRAVNEFG